MYVRLEYDDNIKEFYISVVLNSNENNINIKEFCTLLNIKDTYWWPIKYDNTYGIASYANDALFDAYNEIKNNN